MKRIKMVLYGEPGVGKSVFASKAPKPFFIASDGNYEWLEDFGADPNAHIEVSTWSEAKKAFKADYSDYETIVVDLLEDLFKWCEYEFCQKNHLDHISDAGGWSKGYDVTRTEFFIEICKLLALDKNVILIMHGTSTTTKDRRGVEHVKHIPSTRLPDKVIDMIEGRVRYFLRCYVRAEDDGTGTLVKKRYLSLVPKENEFGIIRGVDETKVPQDIPLDFDTFTEVIGFNTSSNIQEAQVLCNKKRVEHAIQLKKQIQDEELKATNESVDVDTSVVSNEIKQDTEKFEETNVEDVTENLGAEKDTNRSTADVENIQKVDKLAAIKARLAAKKAENGGN